MKTGFTLSPIKTEERQAIDFRSGDTVRVWSKIKEGKDKEGKDKFRLQAFEGIVLSRKHGMEAGATFTVRKVAHGGIGVERIFPLYSPSVESIELLRRSKSRRSKLYYIRDKAAKEIRKKMKSETVRVVKKGSVTTQEAVIKEEPVVEAAE